MEVTFHPFDPDLAQHFATAWRRHPGDVAAIMADLRTHYPDASIGEGAPDGWHVYREVTPDEGATSRATAALEPPAVSSKSRVRTDHTDVHPRAPRPGTRR